MILDRKKIDIIRARSMLSDKELASRYGTTEQNMRFILAKIPNRTTRPLTAGRLAKALGVDVSEIMAD